ncbi:MAG TPA: glycosyltransferase family 2 protein [bacterium]|nr:glycosyltransferase family 2 protein [bacterium]
MKNFSVIIPTYNEEKSIGKVISSIQSISNDIEIIVVNDGSTDKTSEVLKNFQNIKIINHPYNKGNGAAVKSGILESTNENIVIIDADGQHDPDDILKLVQELDNYDLIVGARSKESETEKFRDIGNFIFKKLGSFLTGFNIPDMTSGFRAFKKKHIIKFFNLYPNGFSFPTTSTLCFITSGLNVKFINIKSQKREKDTKSKIKPFRDGIKFIILIIKIIMLCP